MRLYSVQFRNGDWHMLVVARTARDAKRLAWPSISGMDDAPWTDLRATRLPADVPPDAGEAVYDSECATPRWGHDFWCQDMVRECHCYWCRLAETWEALNG
jgi:hypothetical protein